MTTETMTDNQAAHTQQDAVESFQEKMLRASAGVFEMFSMYIGHKLGLYRALADNEPMTSTELSLVTHTQERYIREWCEQQTVAGIVTVVDETAGPFDRRFSLAAARAEVLTDTESLNYLAPLTELIVGAVRPLPQLLDAYRQGGGVPYREYGVDLRQGQAAMNRTMFLQLLGQEWMSALPDIRERLTHDDTATVADFGCGCGWSSIGMALAFPTLRVDGYDSDPASIHEARENAVAYGVADRVTFHDCDVAEATIGQRYDLVLMCEMLHDLGNPVGALKTARTLVAKDGAVLVVDERVAEQFTAEGNDVEWMMYGWSILHCLPVGMADGAEHCCGGTGTVMRPSTVRRYAVEAGFQDVDVLPVDNFFLRLYRLNP